MLLAVYKEEVIYRKYKELRDTSPGNPKPMAPQNRLCKQICDPQKGGSTEVFQVTLATQTASSYNHRGNSGQEMHRHTHIEQQDAEAALTPPEQRSQHLVLGAATRDSEV